MKFARKTAALLACVLLCAMSAAAYAQGLDPNQTGSIRLTFAYKGNAVPGGTVTAYRVGDIAQSDGNYDVALTTEFAGSGEDLSNLSSAELAQALADYAAVHSISGTPYSIDNNGHLEINVTAGLYLLVQTGATVGYEPVKPFLVSLPHYDEEAGVYKYDVDATPKMGTLTETPHHHDPEPTAPVVPGGPSGGSKLPQSGQLNWPVPVLSSIGMCLFLLGFALRLGERKKPYEA